MLPSLGSAEHQVKKAFDFEATIFKMTLYYVFKRGKSR